MLSPYLGISVFRFFSQEIPDQVRDEVFLSTTPTPPYHNEGLRSLPRPFPSFARLPVAFPLKGRGECTEWYEVLSLVSSLSIIHFSFSIYFNTEAQSDRGLLYYLRISVSLCLGSFRRRSRIKSGMRGSRPP